MTGQHTWPEALAQHRSQLQPGRGLSSAHAGLLNSSAWIWPLSSPVILPGRWPGISASPPGGDGHPPPPN